MSLLRLSLTASALIFAQIGLAQTPVKLVPALPADPTTLKTNVKTDSGEIFGPKGALLPDLGPGVELPDAPEFAADEPFEARKLSLRRVPVPKPSNLADFVADEKAALVLGKALFWDMQVGSDGVMACASCHFHAGADNRSRAQLSPGLLRVSPTGMSSPDTTFQSGTTTRQLRPEDFPFHKLLAPDNRNSTVLSDSNDVVGSQGVSNTRYARLVSEKGAIEELNVTVNDKVFTSGSSNLRRVTPRNAPSVINAVFNVRNFWDGRAQRVFNGVNSWGGRDAGATVWRASVPGLLAKVKIALDRSSLASQAVGPALSSFEMSSAGREFPDLGKRLLRSRPLANQQVHASDSVLASLAATRGGLTTATYAELVRAAFRPEWWQGTGVISDDGSVLESEKQERRRVASANGLDKLDDDDAKFLTTSSFSTYSQMEANFSLFFGLAIQIYESTLVSNDAPIDRYAEGDTKALTPLQLQGLGLFNKKARCAACHAGATFTAAALVEATEQRVELGELIPKSLGVYDAGFYNIGVRPILEDIGIGARDPWGKPLAESRLISLSRSARAALTGYDEFFFQFPTDIVLGYGFFKTPSLRNVELTAPYFHNGSQATLEQVVSFYNRGGDFREWGHNEAVRPLKLTADEQAALVAFLKSLTDDRVRYDRAPFDHPQLFITNGPKATNGKTASDTLIEIPAVGAAGGAGRKNFLQ
jgi:cytochrome c peroxidase